MKGEEVNRADVAASFQQSVTDVLTEHTVGAAKRLGINKVAIAGGVLQTLLFARRWKKPAVKME